MPSFNPTQRTEADPDLSWRRVDGKLQESERRARRDLLAKASTEIIGKLLNAGLYDDADPTVFIDSTAHLNRDQFQAEVINGGMFEKPTK